MSRNLYVLQIPKEIGLLHSLSCFDVSHNKDVRHLPYEMGNLEYLFMVSLLYVVYTYVHF